MHRLLPILGLLVACTSSTGEPPPSADIDIDGKADRDGYTVRVTFGEGSLEPIREVTPSGSPTLDDLAAHTPEQTAVAFGDTPGQQAYARSLEFELRPPEKFENAGTLIYMLDDRMVTLGAPTLESSVIVVPDSDFQDGHFNEAKNIQMYWAAFIYKAMAAAEMGEPFEGGAAGLVLEQSFLAAAFYSEIERQDPTYITPAFEEFMEEQMERAMAAAADASHSDKVYNIDGLRARAGELRNMVIAGNHGPASDEEPYAVQFSPKASDLVQRLFFLPDSF